MLPLRPEEPLHDLRLRPQLLSQLRLLPETPVGRLPLAAGEVVGAAQQLSQTAAKHHARSFGVLAPSFAHASFFVATTMASTSSSVPTACSVLPSATKFSRFDSRVHGTRFSRNVQRAMGGSGPGGGGGLAVLSALFFLFHFLLRASIHGDAFVVGFILYMYLMYQP